MGDRKLEQELEDLIKARYSHPDVGDWGCYAEQWEMVNAAKAAGFRDAMTLVIQALDKAVDIAISQGQFTAAVSIQNFQSNIALGDFYGAES